MHRAQLCRLTCSDEFSSGTATFAALWAKAHGISDGLRGARPVAKDILRDPNWFVLGAVSRCTATVVTPDCKEYRFSSFANELSSADVGREVP